MASFAKYVTLPARGDEYLYGTSEQRYGPKIEQAYRLAMGLAAADPLPSPTGGERGIEQFMWPHAKRRKYRRLTLEDIAA